ncbi:hypothetical protein J6590_001490 [Homalodisca vitripennis]|nr:hypothetical protein J6590_095392 [Homalodisca vitripennis]KAG8323741.1 hypothetical protein J6590_001490 [Homalodisca vitripennis]
MSRFNQPEAVKSIKPHKVEPPVPASNPTFPVVSIASSVPIVSPPLQVSPVSVPPPSNVGTMRPASMPSTQADVQREQKLSQVQTKVPDVDNKFDMESESETGSSVDSSEYSTETETETDDEKGEESVQKSNSKASPNSQPSIEKSGRTKEIPIETQLDFPVETKKEYKSELNIQVTPKPSNYTPLISKITDTNSNVQIKPVKSSDDTVVVTKVKSFEQPPFYKSADQLQTSNYNTFPLSSGIKKQDRSESNVTLPRTGRNVRFEEMPNVRNIMELDHTIHKKPPPLSNVSKSMPSLNSPKSEHKFLTSITEIPSPSHVEYTNIQPTYAQSLVHTVAPTSQVYPSQAPYRVSSQLSHPPGNIPHMFHGQAPVMPIISNGIAYIPVQMSSPPVPTYFPPNSFPFYSPTSPKSLRGGPFSPTTPKPLHDQHFNQQSHHSHFPFPSNKTPSMHSYPNQTEQTVSEPSSSYPAPSFNSMIHSNQDYFSSHSFQGYNPERMPQPGDSVGSSSATSSFVTPFHPIPYGHPQSLPNNSQQQFPSYNSVYSDQYPKSTFSSHKHSSEVQSESLTNLQSKHEESHRHQTTSSPSSLPFLTRSTGSNSSENQRDPSSSSSVFERRETTPKAPRPKSEVFSQKKLVESSARLAFLNKSLENVKTETKDIFESTDSREYTMTRVSETTTVEKQSQASATPTPPPPPVNYSTLPSPHLSSPSWMEIFESTPPLLEGYGLHSTTVTTHQVGFLSSVCFIN